MKSWLYINFLCTGSTIRPGVRMCPPTLSKNHSGNLYQAFTVHVLPIFILFGAIFDLNWLLNLAEKYKSSRL